MTKELIIERTINAINKLPDTKAIEISDFAAFICNRYKVQELVNEVQTLISESQTFHFLKNEEELYFEKDIKVRYNAKG